MNELPDLAGILADPAPLPQLPTDQNAWNTLPNPSPPIWAQRTGDQSITNPNVLDAAVSLPTDTPSTSYNSYGQYGDQYGIQQQASQYGDTQFGNQLGSQYGAQQQLRSPYSSIGVSQTPTSPTGVGALYSGSLSFNPNTFFNAPNSQASPLPYNPIPSQLWNMYGLGTQSPNMIGDVLKKTPPPVLPSIPPPPSLNFNDNVL